MHKYVRLELYFSIRFYLILSYAPLPYPTLHYPILEIRVIVWLFSHKISRDNFSAATVKNVPRVLFKMLSAFVAGLGWLYLWFMFDLRVGKQHLK